MFFVLAFTIFESNSDVGRALPDRIQLKLELNGGQCPPYR